MLSTMHHPFVKLALAAASSSTRVNWSRCAAYAHACLECLRAKLQERGADGSLDEFRMSLADFPWKVALPAALCLALLAMAKQLLHPSRNQPVSPLQFTQALLRFIVPGGSVWPARYARMPVSRGVASLGYGALVRDLVNGVVELRSTRYARLLVLCSPFDLGVCVVSFRMELRMWTSAICFLLKNELPFQTFKVRMFSSRALLVANHKCSNSPILRRPHLLLRLHKTVAVFLPIVFAFCAILEEDRRLPRNSCYSALRPSFPSTAFLAFTQSVPFIP